VAFHWSEAEASLSGSVPPELTEKLDPHRLAMLGTNVVQPHCVALRGTVGEATQCSIYVQRPSVCREVTPSWESGAMDPQCDRARLKHGMTVLTPQDWPNRSDGT
jgi:hypothetical protein